MAWSDVCVVLCLWLALVLWSLYAATWKEGVPIIIGSWFDGYGGDADDASDASDASDVSDVAGACVDGDENEDACSEPYKEPTGRAKCD